MNPKVYMMKPNLVFEESVPVDVVIAVAAQLTGGDIGVITESSGPMANEFRITSDDPRHNIQQLVAEIKAG